jgi:hypothetical protein
LPLCNRPDKWDDATRADLVLSLLDWPCAAIGDDPSEAGMFAAPNLIQVMGDLLCFATVTIE